MKKIVLSLALLFAFSCGKEDVQNFLDPAEYGYIQIKGSIPSLGIVSKIPDCGGGNGPWFVRIEMVDEQNQQWNFDIENVIFENTIFYGGQSEPIPVGQYTVTAVSIMGGTEVVFAAPDIAEAEIIPQFAGIATPFYIDIEPDADTYVGVSLFCYQQLEQIELGNIDSEGSILRLRDLNIYLDKNQRICADKIRLEYVGGVDGPTFAPYDYDINPNSPLTTILAVYDGEVVVALIVDGQVVEEFLVDVYNDFSTPVRFGYNCN